MAQQLQLIHDRTLQTKQEMKELKAIVKDTLANSSSYQEIYAEIKELRAKKKSIETALTADLQSELDQLDTLKLDLDNDKLLLSDSALIKLVKGERVEVEDKNGTRYEPIFTVKFKKI